MGYDFKVAVLDSETDKPYELKPVKINPYTGEQLVSQASEVTQNNNAGYWPLTRKNILAFIYVLHYSLALGDVGVWLFGIAAIIWMADCFVGFYLTLPVPKKKHLSDSVKTRDRHSCKENSNSEDRDTFQALPSRVQGTHHFMAIKTTNNEIQRSFWQRWQISWKIKWPASTYRINFDLHRAGGLWTWMMLFMFAWSSVLLNLTQQVYIPVMKQFFEMTDGKYYPILDLQQPRPDPVIDFRAAHQTGQRLMAEQAQQKGFKVLKERSLSYDPAKGLYIYTIRSDHDLETKGATMLWLDGISGAFVGLYLPTGQKAGDTITLWLQSLHMAHIGGLPYKLFVCLMGLVVAMLSITGVYIWLKKCRARCLSKERKIRLAEETHA